MCVARGDGGGRLRSGLISVPGSDSASPPRPTGEIFPARGSAGTGHACWCPQQEGARRQPRACTPNLLPGVQQLRTLPCTLAFQITLVWPGTV